MFLAFVLLWASAATILLMPRYSKPVAVADVGTTAPDFELHDTQGRSIQLAGCRGQAVVLFFCNSFPTPQEDYTPRVAKLAEQYQGDGRVQFLAIAAADESAGASAALRPFPTLVDDHGAVAARYSAYPKPFLIVIDPKGQVRYRGGFDDNRDTAFVTQNYCADALRDVLGAPETSVASIRK